MKQRDTKKSSKKTSISPKQKSKTPLWKRSPHYLYKRNGREILLLGTAHVSRNSVEDVNSAVASFKPDTICVELCESRYQSLSDPDRWKKTDLIRVIKEKKFALLVSSLILSSFQKKMGALTQTAPGQEMLLASELAKKTGSRLVLADRNIQTTLSRSWGNVGFFSKMWIISNLTASLLVSEELKSEDIEELKKKDILEDLFDSLPPKYGQVKHILIDERDLYLSEKIQHAAFESGQTDSTVIDFRRKKKSKETPRRLLAVVGAGHLKGIKHHLIRKQRTDLTTLDSRPASGKTKTILVWLFISILALFISYLASRGNDWQGLALEWVVARSLGAGLGALIAMAHPLTILVTMLVAPVSVFLFGTKLWMYSAVVELWLRKPRVEDFENIASDTESFAGFLKSIYRNRVLHLIFVVFMVSLGGFTSFTYYIGRIVAKAVSHFLT